jgi:1-acyl-sn-glycerol-3-phosphate acyltransferase
MRDRVYPSVIRFALTLFRVLGFRFDLRGVEHLPTTGGAVLASNHVSYFDFMFVGLTGWRRGKRLVRFMAKDAVFHHRVSGPLMRGMHHIPVDREAGAGSYQSAVEALRAGELVGVFPEATISQSFELKEFKSGAVRMAQEAGVPILPAVVWGSQRVWTKNRKKDLRRGTEIRVVLGEPYEPLGDPTAATEELKKRMQVLLEEARATYGGKQRGGEDTGWLPASMGGTAPTLEDAQAADARERAERAARRAARHDPSDN